MVDARQPFGLPADSLLHIACSSYSGSTLLGLLLSRHPLLAATSQLTDLALAARSPDAMPCTCGAPVFACPQWQAVAATLVAQPRLDASAAREVLAALPLQPAVPAALSGPVERTLAKLALAIDQPCAFKVLTPMSPSLEALQRSAHTWLQVAAGVRAVTGRDIVVDASKNAALPTLLARLAPSAFRCVWLVRDGRAVMLSRMRRRGESAQLAARNWARHSLGLLWLRAGLPTHRVFALKYEDLCADPAIQLTDLQRFLGVPVRDLIAPLDKRSPHLVGGNPMRYDLDSRSIAPDDRWQRELSKDDLRIFARIAGPVQAALGYPIA